MGLSLGPLAPSSLVWMRLGYTKLNMFNWIPVSYVIKNTGTPKHDHCLWASLCEVSGNCSVNFSVPENGHTHKPLEPREGEPRQPRKACQGLLVAIGPCYGLLGRLGSPSLG